MRINNKWTEHHGMLLKAALAGAVLLIIVFTFCKRCTQVARPAAEEVYVPNSDEGFVKKANMLLAHLVEQGNKANEGHHPHTITEMQKHYPALEFALPYDIDAVEGGRAADIRLVGIIADSIKDEDDRRFFYNSDIPTLLKRQRNNLGERVFRIRFASDKDLVISNISIHPSMFKVALVKDPWKGTVVASDNTLFPQTDHCFLTWGKSVLPIKSSGEGHIARGGGHEKVVALDEASRCIVMSKGQPLDYYQLYKAYKADTTTVCVKMPGSKRMAIYLDYLKDHRVRVKPVDCHCQVYDEAGAMESVAPLSSSMKGNVYDLNGVVKLVVTRQEGKDKVCELMLTRTNPMLLLSGLTHTNEGRARYSIAPNLTDRFTQQVLRGLTTSLQNTVFEDTVHLSIDPLLSLEMERELEKYVKRMKGRDEFYGDDQWEMSLTVMDMANGAIVAAPYYRSADSKIDYNLALDRKNPALMRRFIGSTFKPLAALAAVLTQPSLNNLSTVGDYKLLEETKDKKRKALFYGHETTAWSAKGGAAGFWNGCKSMADFFAVSDDVYPVALVAKALNYGKAGSPFVFHAHDVMLETNNNFTWAGSRFVNTLDHLYNIPGTMEYMSHDSLQMMYYAWQNLKVKEDDKFGLDNVSPDPTLFNYDNFTRKGATLHNELATWVLGQGTNEWNCLKLAEAWSRMLTKRKVEASLVSKAHATTLRSLAEGYDGDAWNGVLEALLKAQSRSPKLLTPMNKVVETLNKEMGIKDTLLLFSKTGTPDNYTRMEWKSVTGGPKWIDVGLYCMALMPKSAYASVKKGEAGKGLMCVVRLTRIVGKNHKQVTKNGNADGIRSSDARNFFSDNPQLLRKFYEMTKDRYGSSIKPKK